MSEKRSVPINEMKEALKSELVTKIHGGRVWVVRIEGTVVDLDNLFSKD